MYLQGIDPCICKENMHSGQLVESLATDVNYLFQKIESACMVSKIRQDTKMVVHNLMPSNVAQHTIHTHAYFVVPFL
jgi:hypothetical protein